VGCHGNTRDANSLGENSTPTNANLNDVVGMGTHSKLNSFAPGVNPKQSFVGWMVYDRTWFKKDRYGLTLGVGQINNPGRYLVLVPPINGETAPTAGLASPYFPYNPNDPFKAWDSSITFDYMPKQWLTFRVEYDYRYTNVNYWSGHQGLTPPTSSGFQPGTNNGSPTQTVCNDGTPSTDAIWGYNPATSFCGPVVPVSSITSVGPGAHGGLWQPNLQRAESLVDIDWMVKF
jgi:hypothetical protein